MLESFDDPARTAYLTALTANLTAKSEELYRYWSGEGQNYAQSFRKNDSEGADLNGSVSLLANEMIELHEITMAHKAGNAHGPDDRRDPSAC